MRLGYSVRSRSLPSHSFQHLHLPISFAPQQQTLHQSTARKATAGVAPHKRLAAQGPGFKTPHKQIKPRGAAGPLQNRNVAAAAARHRRRPGVAALQ